MRRAPAPPPSVSHPLTAATAVATPSTAMGVPAHLASLGPEGGANSTKVEVKCNGDSKVVMGPPPAKAR